MFRLLFLKKAEKIELQLASQLFFYSSEAKVAHLKKMRFFFKK